MMVSSKGRYALRVMLDMAEQGDGAWLRLSDIAQRQQLSKKYLESIMAALSRAGLVESSVGKAGGYRLTRPPGEYPVGEILRAAEGDLCEVSCISEEKAGCGRRRSTPMWTITRWHNSCIQGKNQRAAPAARKENKAV